MIIRLIFLLISIPFATLGQTPPDFDKLIEEINHSLKEYTKLSPYGDDYYAVSGFGFSEQEIEEVLKDADYDAVLSQNKDSIQGFHMIFVFQEIIVEQIEQILKHPDFLKHDLIKLIESEELSIVKSDDNKLWNLFFDEKTGGTYRAQISMMYYVDEQSKEVTDVTNSPVFADDGYNEIYTLETQEGRKYVLTGNVRGCSYCFETFVQVLNSELVEEFKYSVNNRDWNDGVFYDPDTKTIHVDYHIDDLTTSCYCGDEGEETEFPYDKFVENDTSINCVCKFIFNGKGFELVEEGWKRVDNINRRE